MGGTGPVSCCTTVGALRDKGSATHVQMVEAGFWEAVIVVAGGRSPAGPMGALGSGLGLEMDYS